VGAGKDVLGIATLSGRLDGLDAKGVSATDILIFSSLYPSRGVPQRGEDSPEAICMERSGEMDLRPLITFFHSALQLRLRVFLCTSCMDEQSHSGCCTCWYGYASVRVSAGPFGWGNEWRRRRSNVWSEGY